MSRSRRFGSFSRQRVSSRLIERRRGRRQRRPVGLARDDGREDVGDGVAGKRGAACEHLVQDQRRTPRCPRACRRSGPWPAPAPCRPPCRGSCPSPSSRATSTSANSTRRRRSAAARRLAAACARPKSSTFTTPSGRTLTLAGFRSRWTMPASCAASSASGDLMRDAAAPRRQESRPGRCDRRAWVLRPVPARGPSGHPAPRDRRWPRCAGGSATPGPRLPAGIARGVRHRPQSDAGRTLIATSRFSLLSRAR